jgi:hypothetical protein
VFVEYDLADRFVIHGIVVHERAPKSLEGGSTTGASGDCGAAAAGAVSAEPERSGGNTIAPQNINAMAAPAKSRA